MYEWLTEHESLIFFSVIVVLMGYGSAGAVKAFCRWRKIKLSWLTHLVSSLLFSLIFLLAITGLALSGVFITLVGYAILFAIVFTVVRLIVHHLTRP